MPQPGVVMSHSETSKLPLPSLRNIQAFIEVANAQSIHVAAEQLNITASAVSHQIAALEKFLNKKLFIRNGKGVTLTEHGEIYLREISGAISIIGRATDKIINESSNEILRVHSSPSFGMIWLMRRLGKFRTLHPDITINLTCSYENLQFARDNIDIDIRHGIPDWDAYRVMTIKNERLKVMASPDYISKHPLSRPEEILNHNLIYSSVTLANWDKWFSYCNLQYARPNFNLSFDRSYMSFEAARMGLGLILESSMMGEEFLKNGSLVQVFPREFEYPVSAHHIVMPHINERTHKVKVFIEWMRHELAIDGYIL